MSYQNLGTTHENGEPVGYPLRQGLSATMPFNDHFNRAKEANTVPAEKSGALAWSATHLRIAADAAGIALWSWNVDTDEIAGRARA
jgi:hypothetical protein